MNSPNRTTSAFTLVELIVVLGIIGALASLLLPAFARAREQANRSACLSNLRQIGMAVQEYTQDNNDQFPYGADPCDLYTTGWIGTPFADQVTQMQPLTDVMAPYISSPDLWRCPSDSGYTVCGLSGDALLDTRPSAFQEYGMSYVYHTDLALMHLNLSTVKSSDNNAPFTEHGPAEIPLLGDTDGAWHGGGLRGELIYNLLFVDGHVDNENQSRVRYLWALKLAQQR